jgi:L-fucose isomerase-like protein
MRLSRVNGNYKMVVAKGKFIEKKPDPNIPAENLPWPKAHVQFNFNPRIFVEEYDSQHAHIVEGDYVEECKNIGELLNMDVKVFT